jgi:hypothetical protein
VKGIVDDELRALIEVSIGSEPASEKSSVMVWVDTAFNGGLVLLVFPNNSGIAGQV